MKYAGTIKPTTLSGTSPSVIATAQAVTGLSNGGTLATLTSSGATDTVALFAPHARLSSASVHVGQSQTATGAGFLAGERVQAVIHSTPVTVGTAKADALGVVNVRYAVAASVPAGAHTVTLTGLTSGLSASQPLTVVAAAPSGTATGSPVAPSSSGSVGGVSTSTTPSTGVLANSGRDDRTTTALGVIGALAVAVGAGLLLLGRRRTH